MVVTAFFALDALLEVVAFLATAFLAAGFLLFDVERAAFSLILSSHASISSSEDFGGTATTGFTAISGAVEEVGATSATDFLLR